MLLKYKIAPPKSQSKVVFIIHFAKGENLRITFWSPINFYFLILEVFQFFDLTISSNSAPVFLPGESHGQRSLAGNSPGVVKSRSWLKDFHFISFPNSTASVNERRSGKCWEYETEQKRWCPAIVEWRNWWGRWFLHLYTDNDKYPAEIKLSKGSAWISEIWRQKKKKISLRSDVGTKIWKRCWKAGWEDKIIRRTENFI